MKKNNLATFLEKKKDTRKIEEENLIPQISGLRPLTICKSFLYYDLLKLPGAVKKVYLDVRTIEKIKIVDEYLKKKSSSTIKYELLVWDAFRTKETQSAIYNSYANEISKKEKISFEKAYPRAKEFVSQPDGIFPHGTGGAIDVTLLKNNTPVNMGTEFDEFSEKSYKNYFRENRPKNKEDTEAHRNRELLREAMEYADFVGIENEWWHYEWGTKFWAENKNKKIILTKCYDSIPNIGQTPAYIEDDFKMAQPVWFSGIAQIFENPMDRASALSKNNNYHYYARTSNPTVNALGSYIKENIVNAKNISLVSSGFSACKTALLSMVPENGIVLCDQKIYYEVATEIYKLSKEFNWTVIYADFTDPKKILTKCKELKKNSKAPDVFYFDSPINWWLECIDLKKIKGISIKYKVKILADISVQPLQPSITQYADMVVFSLSKYPSLGLTLGGAILTNNVTDFKKIEGIISRNGDRLSSDSANTIWCQIISLQDRMESVSRKVLKIKNEIKNLKLIKKILTIDENLYDGLVGGMMVIVLKNKNFGPIIENIVGHNSNRKKTTLHLAFTFGGAMTTLEHFYSNPRLSSNFKNPELINISEDFIRISLGCETVEDIISDITMIFKTAEEFSNFSKYDKKN